MNNALHNFCYACRCLIFSAFLFYILELWGATLHTECYWAKHSIFILTFTDFCREAGQAGPCYENRKQTPKVPGLSHLKEDRKFHVLSPWFWRETFFKWLRWILCRNHSDVIPKRWVVPFAVITKISCFLFTAIYSNYKCRLLSQNCAVPRQLKHAGQTELQNPQISRKKMQSQTSGMYGRMFNTQLSSALRYAVFIAAY